MDKLGELASFLSQLYQYVVKCECDKKIEKCKKIGFLSYYQDLNEWGWANNIVTSEGVRACLGVCALCGGGLDWMGDG